MPGAWGALAFACVSLSPSLLPRGAVTQGVLTGISTAMGYAVGLVSAWLWRAFADREPRTPEPIAWRWFLVAATVFGAAALLLGQRWQARILDLVGGTGAVAWLPLVVPAIALPVWAGLLGIARRIRGVARWLTARLSRVVGPRAAGALGGLTVATILVLAFTGVLLDGLLAAADRTFSLRDATTNEGVEPPDSSLRSGGPGSLITWESLGRQGRSFTAGGPSVADIVAIRGFADEPIRIYGGIASADEVEDRARLVVDDLVRAGGFEREHLLVATTTGTGWLDPGTMESFEQVARGDSAIVTMQYSYLPSWLSYLVDQARAREAGRELFDAVYERWSRLPPDERPRLHVFGGSLGAFGAEAAFSGEFDLRNRTDAALFVGPPSFSPLHLEFTEGRDPGSRQIEPVYRDGRTVRFSNDMVGRAEPRGAAWEGTRVLYLQHPSDPVVWWSPRLLIRRPEWLAEPRGHDVLDQMVWVPFVTFWQVTLDMPFSGETTDGHGHRYTSESLAAWVALLQPDDWSEEQAEAVRARIAR